VNLFEEESSVISAEL
jgi:hypothetical protein